MSRLAYALIWGMLLALSACRDGLVGSDEETLVADPDQMELYLGESAQIVSQVLGRKVPVRDAMVYWSRNTSVAIVSGTGVVSGVVPGSTTVMVRYKTQTDSVQVVVRRDARGALKVLDIVPAEVTAATESRAVEIPYVALDGYERTNCIPTGLSLRFNPFILSASIRSSATDCALEVDAGAAGETYLVASVAGLSDSVLVKVVDGAFQAMFTSGTGVSATAGAATPLTVVMLDPRGAPVAGQTVWFTARPGLLDRTTVTTDSAGTATVTWTPPRVLAASGGTAQVTFRTLFPTGEVRAENRSVPLYGGTPQRVEWYAGDPTPLRVGGRTLTAALNSYRIVSAVGRDAYGNQTLAVPTLSYAVLLGPGPQTHDARGVQCVSNLDDPLGLERYTACYASYGFQSAATTDIRVYASFPGGPADSLDVSFR